MRLCRKMAMQTIFWMVNMYISMHVMNCARFFIKRRSACRIFADTTKTLTCQLLFAYLPNPHFAATISLLVCTAVTLQYLSVLQLVAIWDATRSWITELPFHNEAPHDLLWSIELGLATSKLVHMQVCMHSQMEIAWMVHIATTLYD